ncbi:MAG TPA: hypothetical protein VN802_23755 [Stellaceae bacterium]|nr:hypothetical protein [Stellaceae bacterium]
MSTGELAYLTLIVSGFLVFMATLAWVSRRPVERKPRTWAGGADATAHSARH